MFVNATLQLAWESAGCLLFLKQGNGRRDFATQSVVKKRHTALALYDVKRADNLMHRGITKGANFRAFQNDLLCGSVRNQERWLVEAIEGHLPKDAILYTWGFYCHQRKMKSEIFGSPPRSVQACSPKHVHRSMSD